MINGKLHFTAYFGRAIDDVLNQGLVHLPDGFHPGMLTGWRHICRDGVRKTLRYRVASRRAHTCPLSFVKTGEMGYKCLGT